MSSHSIVVVGVNYRSAPVSLLERLTIPDDELDKALDHILVYEHIVEAVVLSTCNRIEAYAAVTKFHGGAQDLRNFLSEARHVAPEDFANHLYTYHDDTALRHLFRVAAGIDSMIVGESEILGQVRRAHERARVLGAAGPVLSSSFTAAVRVGRKARSETAIGKNPVSVSSAAVELARRSGGLTGRRVAVVGTGKMGSLAARALGRAGAAEIVLVNRTEARADEVAAALGATVAPWRELDSVLASADVVISSTTAPGVVLDAARLAAAAAARDRDAPLVVVDIAVPRDVAPEARSLDGIVVYDIDDLRGIAESGLERRRSEMERVEEIIEAEITRRNRLSGEDARPVAAALVDRAEKIREVELRRIRRILDELSPEKRAAVERAVARALSKMIHDPLERMKILAGEREARLYLETVRDLFGLDD